MLADTPENTATRAVVSSLNQFYEVLYSGAMFLADTELERLQKKKLPLPLGPIAYSCGPWPLTRVCCGGM